MTSNSNSDSSMKIGDFRVDVSRGITPSIFASEEFDLFSVPQYPTGQPERTLGADIGSGKKTVEPGTVLFCKINPRINRVWVVPGSNGRRQIASTEWIQIAPVDMYLPKYLRLFLSQNKIRDYAAANVSGVGGSLTRINPRVLDEIEVPVTPLVLQRAIVAEIETQFARLDAAVASLQRAKARLKRYRASVLKAACEGRLVPTEAELARQEGRDYEPASVLLERIAAQRAASGAGKRGRGAKGRADAGVRTDPFDSLRSLRAGMSVPTDAVLPEGWAWTTLLEISGQIGDVDHRMPKAQSSGIPYVSTKDFHGENGIDYEHAKRISCEDFHQLSRKIVPEFGDILLSRYGTVGEVRLVLADKPFQASYSVAIVKMPVSPAMARYVATCLRSPSCQAQIRSHIRASSQPDVGLASIRSLWIPLPPLPEQERIESEVERVTSLIDQLETTVEANLKRAESLRQSVLRRAFSGRLVGRADT